MRLRFRHFAIGTALAFGLCACGAAGAGEPSEAQMKDAMEYAVNHPPGITVTEPGKITFFEKKVATIQLRRVTAARSQYRSHQPILAYRCTTMCQTACSI